MQASGFVLLLVTLRAIVDNGAPSLMHIVLCASCFAVVMRGASHSVGDLIDKGKERDTIWFVYSTFGNLLYGAKSKFFADHPLLLYVNSC